MLTFAESADGDTLDPVEDVAAIRGQGRMTLSPQGVRRSVFLGCVVQKGGALSCVQDVLWQKVTGWRRGGADLRGALDVSAVMKAPGQRETVRR